MQAKGNSGTHKERKGERESGRTSTALLAVTVAMPKAKANCIFEAYINIFVHCAARAPDALTQIKRDREQRQTERAAERATDRQQ